MILINGLYMKRLIGRHFDDKTVQSDIKSWPFKVISDDGLPKVMVQRNSIDTILSPEDISAMILTKMKHTAEAYLETSVKKAVITVPAFFSEFQRKATLKAGEVAGLEVVRLLNEPTAAAIAYATMKEEMRGTVLVYDLGGGTLDVSILTVTDTYCRVRATFGNTHLGGQDFSNNLLKHMINICRNKYKKDITHNKRAVTRLMRECEDAKTKLSFVSQVKICVDCLVDGMDFCENITAAKFNEINSDLFNATLQSVSGAIESAGLANEEIDKVIMVGGSSRIPKLQSLLENFFDKDVYTSINPDEAIAYGATIYAAVCSGVNIRDKSNLIIEDIIPMSLGIGTEEDFEIYSVVISKNSTIPISNVRQYVTLHDNQTDVTFPVYEGEAHQTKENIFLDKFSIYGVPPRPRGEEKFDVTFAIDINDMKRLMGHHFDDETVQTDIRSWPFKVISDNGHPKVTVRRNNIDTILSPEDISAMILTKMKHTAEAYLETSVKKAVITVPAFFSESQRKATLEAGQMAGLEVTRLLNEPTAAAIAYATIKEEMRGTVLVYDLGGGTLDVSILTVTDTHCKVRATYGSTHLGGQDFSNNLLKHMINICRNKYKKDITQNKRAITRLMRECEDAKTKLSFVSQVKIHVDCLIDGIDFCENITAAKFNEINSDLFNATLESVTGAIESSGLAKEEIDKVIMVGGSSRIPKLQSLLQQFFDKGVYMSINPEEAIAQGATIFAAACNGINIGDKSNLIIQDIIPLSLGIGTEEDFKVYSVGISKKSAISISKVRQYVTHDDNETVVTIPVYEGEAPQTKDNTLLDKFSIYDVPSRPKGEEKFDVTFTVDINGVLRVTAKHISTGNEKSITSVRKY
ncbi:hypothetical protein Trydic_g8792 [Trypoxylus dichotomus]